MQRRRLNVKFLAWMLGGTAVFCVGVYVLHELQMGWNARELLANVDKYIEEDKLGRAKSALQQYVVLEPTDGEQVERLAKLALQIANQPVDNFDQRRKNWLDAYNAMESALRSFPENDELRRDQVDFCMQLRQHQAAVTHSRKLVERNPDNGEFQALYCRALFAARSYADAEAQAEKIIGYDGNGFDTMEAIAPDNTSVYRLLAQHLIDTNNDLDGADKVMDRLVEVNPASFEALKVRGRYLLELRSRLGENTREQVEEMLDKASTDMERAREMDADDAEAILLAGRIKMRQEDFDGAGELFDIAIEKHPENPQVYLMKNNLARFRRNGEDAIEKQRKALALIELGLKNVPEDQRYELMYERVDKQLAVGDVEAAKQSLTEMRRLPFFADNFAIVLDFIDARLRMQNGQWIEAANEFGEIRPRMATHWHTWPQRLAPQVDALQGTCYLRTGQEDLANKAFQRAYDSGLRNEAVASVIKRTSPQAGPATESQLQSVIRHITALPPEQRDWSEFESLVAKRVEDSAEERPIDPVQQALFRSQVYTSAKEYDLAKDILYGAIKQNRDAEQLYFAYAVLTGLRDGHDAGLKFLDRTEQEFGDSVSLRITRAKLFAIRNDESLRDDLVALEAGIEKMDKEDRGSFWRQIGPLYRRARLNADALRAVERLAEESPNDLVAQRSAFDLAVSLRDADGMQRALTRIEQASDLGRNHSVWRYCEASRQVALVNMRQREKSSLKSARQLVDRVKQERPEWSDIYRLQAQIDLLENRNRDAIASLEEANRHGRPGAGVIRILHKLYLDSKQYDKARQLTELLPPGQGGAIPLTQQATALIARGDLQEGLSKAEEAVTADPENAAKHRWIADIYNQAKRFDRAETALREAVKLAPDNANYRMSLINSLVQRQKTEAAELELRNAQIDLSDDHLPLLIGQTSAILGRPQEAEQYLLMAQRAKPDNLATMQRLVVFYLSRIYQGSDGRDKANRFLKEMLLRADRVPATDPQIRWARRATAELLARTGVHREILRAMRLIEQNSINGRMEREDDLAIAALLGVQQDAESHRRAVASFESAAAKAALNKINSLQLARLYNRVGRWDDCRHVMYNLFGEHRNDLQVAGTLCSMHLERGELREAEPPLERLIALAPNHPTTLSLKAKLLGKQGKDQEAVATVRSMLPPDSESKTNRLRRYAQLAALLEEIGQVESAEQMHNRRVQITPDANLQLAEFYGRQNDIKKAFELLENLSVSTRDLAPILRVATAVIRVNRDVVGDVYDARVQQWLDKALRENPDSAPLLFALSRFQELQKEYADAEATYKRLVVHPDLEMIARAEVANNLAFLLATQGIRADEAMSYINEAIEVRGPTHALLDTRGCVHILQGNYADAIRDLELALEQTQEPAVYYHLARAYAQSGNTEAAREAMAQARQRGITAHKLTPAERDNYEALKKQLESGTTAGVL